jgi:hypothetical protein
MLDEMRKAFEDWATNNGRYPRAVERTTDGSYKLMKTNTDWIAWATAWNAAMESLEATK